MIGMIDGGGVALHLCGAPRRLRFDWKALGELRAAYGAQFQEHVNAALLELDFDVIARALSLGVSGAVTEEAIKADPPPIVPALNALNRAFNIAYHGPDGAPPEAVKRPLAAARRAIRAILSRMLSALG